MPEPAVLAAIASPRRREILRLTWDAECQAGDIRRAMPDVTWGAVSLQIRALTRVGLLDTRIAGRHRYYRADRARLASVADMLEGMWNDALWQLRLAAELEATRRGPRPRTRPNKARVQRAVPKKPRSARRTRKPRTRR